MSGDMINSALNMADTVLNMPINGGGGISIDGGGISIGGGGGISIGGGGGGNGMGGEGDASMEVDSGAGGGVLSSWSFVIGVSTGTLVVSVLLGILLAKIRIKKGIDIYED